MITGATSMYNLKIHGCHYIMDPSKSTGAKPIDIQIHGCQAPMAPVLTPPLIWPYLQMEFDIIVMVILDLHQNLVDDKVVGTLLVFKDILF